MLDRQPDAPTMHRTDPAHRPASGVTRRHREPGRRRLRVDRRDRRRSAQDRVARRPSPSTCSTRPAARWAKRVVPIVVGLVVLVALRCRSCKRRKQPRAASATTTTDPSRIEPVFDPADGDQPCPRHRPGRVALRLRRGARATASRFARRRLGVIRTPPADPLPDRLAALHDELDGADRRARARRRGRRAGAVPGQRAHRDVGRPGERARARARRRAPGSRSCSTARTR